MKQIQEWLGHSNFATTADVYSHLDFSSKVRSGAIIANALDSDKLLNENTIQNLSETDLMRSVKKQMKAHGFDNLRDYFAYLDALDEQEIEHS